MNGFPRAHKQAGADGSADGDKLQVTVFQIALQTVWRVVVAHKRSFTFGGG